MTPAWVLGPGYLTYVLWAVTPDGQTMNLTELQPNDGGDRVDIGVMVDLPVFGMIITAEPYFAVTQPSDAIAMEIAAIPDEGCFKNVTVNYQLLELGSYYANISAREVTTLYSDRIEPLDPMLRMEPEDPAERDEPGDVFIAPFCCCCRSGCYWAGQQLDDPGHELPLRSSPAQDVTYDRLDLPGQRKAP